METRTIYAIDLIVLAGTLAAILFIVGYARPLLIAPIDKMTSSNSSVLFSFEKGNSVFIDDNIEFSSSEEIEVRDNFILTLKPGHYYWKVRGVVESEIRELTILSEVSLMLRESDGKMEVVNAGNTELDVDIYNNSVLVGKVVLEKEESSDVGGNKVVGRQNG
jgi:hypothetical protein